ncbi:unnamed protein product [Fusarium graminearum]|nr:hypothetical protein HG531_013691 [Fusarium graminearum]CAF3557236.1 unnamed protein product [Fusarium graminearum]
MCVETITIALCAPQSAPRLSFTCGNLHLVAENHVVCDSAVGNCICYFGTCGKVTREVPTGGIDFSAISKVRCTTCTAREDEVGDARKDREILESVLLGRPATNDADWDQTSKRLQQLWQQKSACPYHVQGSVRKAKATVNKPAKEQVQAQVDIKSAVPSAPSKASFGEVVIDKDDLHQSATTDASEHSEADSASTVDPWTGAPVIAEPVTAEPAGFDSPSVKDDVTIVIANDNDGGTSVKAGSDAGKGGHNGLEGDVDTKLGHDAPKSIDGATPVSRRAVNFAFSAEAADKLRDTTAKFASLKSSFLMGKPI